MSSTDKDYIEIVSGVLRKVSETVMGQQNVRYVYILLQRRTLHTVYNDCISNKIDFR